MDVASDDAEKGHYMPSHCLRRATSINYPVITFIGVTRAMGFGERIRELHLKKGWRFRDFTERVSVGHTHLSRIENERLNYGEYPSVSLIHRLAEAFDVDEDELLLLSKRIPEAVKKRVLERPDAFCTFARCDDATLYKLLNEIGPKKSTDGRAAR
jgi:transcriptional regulator with XRE-family HTH domain